MNKKSIILISITLVIFIAIIGVATYAYFIGNFNTNNTANVNTITERNNMVFDTMGGEMSFSVTAANMTEANAGTVAAQNNTTLTVNFTANTPYSMVCSYDIVYEWTSSDKYTAHSQGITEKEFVIKAVLEDNEHVYVGANRINFEYDLSGAVGNQTSATVVTGAQIDGTGNTTSTAVWNLESKFYNANGDQIALAGKTYAGRFKVDNVSCVAGTVETLGEFDTYWFSSTLGEYKTYPATGGIVHTSGPSTGQRVYIAQDNTQYYACGYFGGYGVEICLSQPFTQYGLTGHTAGQDFTSTEQANAKAALLQIFNDAGINITSSRCWSDATFASCIAGTLNCLVGSGGAVSCQDNSERLYCYVLSSGPARCESF